MVTPFPLVKWDDYHVTIAQFTSQDLPPPLTHGVISDIPPRICLRAGKTIWDDQAPKTAGMICSTTRGNPLEI
jgi:hypothetical protein